MAFDAEFIDGFDKYGPDGFVPTIATLAGDWTSLVLGGADNISMVAATVGTGQQLRIRPVTGSSTPTSLSKTLAANYARIIGGGTFTVSALLNNQGVAFGDGATDQLSLGINSSGQIEARRGALNVGTLIATSSQSVAAASTHCIEWDITFHNSAGIIKVWLDGVITSLSLTGQDTCATANNYANTFRLGTVQGSTRNFDVDHLYLWMFLASGGSETPTLTNPLVETTVITADSAVAWSPGAGVLGPAYRTVTTTSSPGANRLTLRKYTPVANCTLNSVSIIPGAASAGAKFKGVVYSDSAGAANTLLSSGTEVIGAVSGATLTLPLVTPQSLTGGTAYWIGYITDTSVAIQQQEATTLGYGAANTYTSGAPGTAPGMTSGLASWQIWGNLTGMATNAQQVSPNPPLGDLSYNQSSTVSQEDLFDVAALTAVPSLVYTAAVKIMCERTDAGARTLDIETKSGSTTSAGGQAGQTPATSYGWLASYFDLDPNTGAAWTASGLNNAKIGYKVAS